MDRRQAMIDETSAFLTAALSGRVPMPRIPVRRVDMGGFNELLRYANARVAVAGWWKWALKLTERFD